MFHKEAQTLKKQLEEIKEKTSKMYSIVDGRCVLAPGVSEEDLDKTIEKLKVIEANYREIMVVAQGYNNEALEANVKANKTKNAMLEIENYYSKMLNREVKIFPEFLRKCYRF